MKQRIVLVVATARNHVIGLDGKMPWQLPEDLAHFKATTLGSSLIMGRKTFESIGRALPGRRTIVISRNENWNFPNVETAANLQAALTLSQESATVSFGKDTGNAINREAAYVVGGGEIYAQALLLADEVIRTAIDISPQGDTFFPELSANQWQLKQENKHLSAGGLSYSIQRWQRR